jgi:transaldolase
MQDPRFHLYLDSADLTELKSCLPHPAVYGVTTSPTLLKRAGIIPAALPGLLEAILDLGVEKVQAQVLSAGADYMIRDAEALQRLVDPQKMVVKIPATREGFRAGAKLIADGVQVTFTAVYALEQAMFAAEFGAAYAAPYLGRLTDSGVDGLALIGKMQALIERREVEGDERTRLLVASIRSRDAFLSLLELGVGAITIPPKLFGEITDHPATLEAERVFITDAASLG